MSELRRLGLNHIGLANRMGVGPSARGFFNNEVPYLTDVIVGVSSQINRDSHNSLLSEMGRMYRDTNRRGFFTEANAYIQTNPSFASVLGNLLANDPARALTLVQAYQPGNFAQLAQQLQPNPALADAAALPVVQTGQVGQADQGNPADTTDDAVAEPAVQPPVPAALNTALTNFLTGNATAEEINALQTATGNPATGRLDREGNLPNATYHGAETLKDAREALGGPLSPTNHPELYTLARARYYEITGLPADRVATPDEITASQARIRGMSPAQIAEYQSVAYLLGKNETPLSAQAGNRINIDGLAGNRTSTSIATVGGAILPPVPASVEAAADADDDLAEQPEPQRVVILDMSIENSRGDRERLLERAPTLLQESLNRNGGNFRVVTFNPSDNEGPQDLASFINTQQNVVGVMQLKEDGIRGDRDFVVSSVREALGGSPTTRLVVTNDALRDQFPQAITAATANLREHFAPAVAGQPIPVTLVPTNAGQQVAQMPLDMEFLRG